MKLIVGLGNPGEKYVNTRHNCGFMVVDHLLKELGTSKDDWDSNKKLKSDIAAFTVKTDSGDEKVILAKPQTFMNESGQSVHLLMQFYKIAAEDLWIVYDELDLPLGTLKIRNGGAAAGHHGVESIMEHVGTDKFWRFRLGIGTSHDKEHAIGRQVIRDAKEFVLGTFNQSEQGKARELVKHGSKALETGLEKGIEAAMNRFNSK
ncbi:MAG: aminoacyl-tRNA hydrolase [Candidatus Levybacteria bacterium]|nr:aminoacyl-tRNA hydrolase [Candidatus Levybacteria bacterium]